MRLIDTCLYGSGEISQKELMGKLVETTERFFWAPIDQILEDEIKAVPGIAEQVSML